MPVPANYWQLRRRSRLCSCYPSSAGTTSTTAGTPSVPFFTPFFNPNFHLFFRQKSYTSSAGTMITTAGIPSDSIFYSFLTQIFTYFSDKSLTHPPRGQQVPLLAPPTPLLLFPKVPLFKCPKMGLWAPESKNVDHFFTPTSPQNDGTQICFVSFRAI